MSKVYWDNGEEITDDALLSFFTGSTTYDLMKEELCQLKHEMFLRPQLPSASY